MPCIMNLFDVMHTPHFTLSVLDTDDSVDYSALVGAIVGGVISGLVLITVCIALFCWCVCKRKQSPGRVVNATQGYVGKYLNIMSKLQPLAKIK